jgi:TfoX/Sxy family transcriptional regulator of competence genes
MPINEKLADRIRESLIGAGKIEEKKMFSGLCFMLKGKMCVCVRGDEMMCRIDPGEYEQALEKSGCRPMIHGGRKMIGYVYVDETGSKSKKDFDYWINLCISYNKIAKASKSKRK